MSRFEELHVYQLALLLQREVFASSKSFPKDELFSLSYQIRKSTRAVGAKIAESWCKRRYPVVSLAKLSDAKAECGKSRHWLQVGLDCEYLGKRRFETLTEQCHVIDGELKTMIREIESWQVR